MSCLKAGHSTWEFFTVNCPLCMYMYMFHISPVLRCFRKCAKMRTFESERVIVLHIHMYIHVCVLHSLQTGHPISCPRWWQVPYFWAGLKAYDFFSGRQLLKPSYFVSKTKALEEFPMLKEEKLTGAIVYYDGEGGGGSRRKRGGEKEKRRREEGRRGRGGREEGRGEEEEGRRGGGKEGKRRRGGGGGEEEEEGKREGGEEEEGRRGGGKEGKRRRGGGGGEEKGYNARKKAILFMEYHFNIFNCPPSFSLLLSLSPPLPPLPPPLPLPPSPLPSPSISLPFTPLPTLPSPFISLSLPLPSLSSPSLYPPFPLPLSLPLPPSTLPSLFLPLPPSPLPLPPSRPAQRCPYEPGHSTDCSEGGYSGRQPC